MQAVYDCIEQGKVGIFESPTGTGKSLSLICGSLTWLREHKRKQFDEAMQNIEIEVDEDEPAWMAEHAREAKRRELLALRREFEGRLEGVRERERRTRERERVKGGEAGWKRRKVGDGDDGHGGDGEGKGDVEDQFALDDYDSDDDDGEGARRNNNNGQPQYSAETTKLLEKLGMIVPTKDERKPDDVLEGVLVDGDPGVLLLAEQILELLQRGVGVDRDNVGPGRHHLAHHRLAEIDEGAEHLACLSLLEGLGLAVLGSV